MIIGHFEDYIRFNQLHNESILIIKPNNLKILTVSLNKIVAKKFYDLDSYSVRYR